MERLTIRNSDGSVSQPMDLRWGDALKRLAAYEDTGLEPEEVAKCRDYREYVRRRFPNLQHIDVLSKADADGRLVVLPCKVGDTVYTNIAMSGWYLRSKKRPYSAKVVFIGINADDGMGGGMINVTYDKGDYMNQFCFSDFGKTVFFNREEAEAAVEREVRTSK